MSFILNIRIFDLRRKFAVRDWLHITYLVCNHIWYIYHDLTRFFFPEM